MKTEAIVPGVIGLLLGVIIAGYAAGQTVNNNHSAMMRMMDTHHNSTQDQEVTDHSEMSMKAMTDQLKNKTGDDFDKAFIEMMIAHHEGAIAMAELIPDQAKHQELKELGEAIILAQSKEIADMKQWQIGWGYSSNEVMQMMHGGH